MHCALRITGRSQTACLVSMHSLVRGAYARGRGSRSASSRCFYALSRARCLCTSRQAGPLLLQDRFYALSRARCLCTLSSRWRRRGSTVSMHSLVRGAYALYVLMDAEQVRQQVSMHSLVRGAYALVTAINAQRGKVSMHSLVRGAYAPTAHWPSSWPTSVSMHSLVRGAYAPEPTPTPEPTPVSMHSLVRGAYAPSAARRRSLTSRFYALSRARCLCTFPHRVVIRHVAGFLCTLSCEVPMHSADATTLDVWFLFLCTLSCEVPMHRSHLSRHGK